jgi:FkbM family methyltransferase
MKSIYYSGLARAGLALSDETLAPLRRFLGRSNPLPGIPRWARHWAAKLLLPRRAAWVQVERGFARGLWLHLSLKDEAVYWLGSYDPRMQDLLEKLCGPGCVFYDIGANLGFFSFAVAKSSRPNGKVVAFEPERDNCLRFREMVIRNNLQDCVELVEAAAWSYTSSAGVLFKRGACPRAHGGVLADGVSPVLAEAEALLVPSISLDDYLNRGQRPPDVVKIDVEGGECEVLKGAAELCSRAKPALICEVHREEAARWIADWLATRGYNLEWYVPDEFYPRLLVAQAAHAV